MYYDTQPLLKFCFMKKLYYCYYYKDETVLEIQLSIGHFLTNFNIWLTEIHFDRPILLYIFNGWQSITYKMSYLQKNAQPISDPYFYHWTYDRHDGV